MRPDGRRWGYLLDNLAHKRPLAWNPEECGSVKAQSTTYASTITHPTGVVGTFYTKETQHGTANIDVEEAWVLGSQAIPRCNNQMSLVKKPSQARGYTAELALLLFKQYGYF
jgi:hypothetical protein